MFGNFGGCEDPEKSLQCFSLQTCGLISLIGGLIGLINGLIDLIGGLIGLIGVLIGLIGVIITPSESTLTS